MTQRRISGTREWAAHNANCCTGCSNGCSYCYARYNAIKRFKTVKSEEEWLDMKVNWKQVNKRWGKKDGTIMFPTTHDITPEILDSCVTVLTNMLRADNNVLIVSKPNLECVKVLCDKLKGYKNAILFRFTIGAYDNKILKYWEPNAPTFGERFDSLQCAYNAGFKTSISVEPMLDATNIFLLFDMLAPYVTNSIWIGKMNKMSQRVDLKTEEDKQMAKIIKDGQTDDMIKSIYEELKDEPLVRWKESLKEVLGLEQNTEAGQDT